MSQTCFNSADPNMTLEAKTIKCEDYDLTSENIFEKSDQANIA
jgi:hypothetical protein